MKPKITRTAAGCALAGIIAIPVFLACVEGDEPKHPHHDRSKTAEHAKAGDGTPVYDVHYAPQGRSWIATGNGDAQFKMLVDRHNLPKPEEHEQSPVQIASYLQKAGSISSVHAHKAAEIFYIISGELIDITDPETDPKFRIAKPGMVTIVHPGQKVIHWVPSETEPVTGLVIWAPAIEEHNLIEHANFLHGNWQSPFEHEGIDRKFREDELPPIIREALKKARHAE